MYAFMSTRDPTFRHSARLTRAARRLVAATGRTPLDYRVEIVSDGSICVRGPGARAFYPPGTWVRLFTRHLQRGIFDA
jgi:hypothetical protein